MVLHDYLEGLLELFYPPLCVACGRRLVTGSAISACIVLRIYRERGFTVIQRTR